MSCILLHLLLPLLHSWACHCACCTDAPAANNAADASTECPTTKLDENLKCGICLELCERPVTVSA